MLHIALCDDLSKDRIKLQEDISAYFADKTEKAEVSAFESGNELLSVIQNKSFHIVFMDVYMEGLNGVETSQQLRKLGKNCAIIFTTTSPDHAMAGYEVSASDYLLKPFSREDVFVALDYAISKLPKAQRSIEIISDRTHLELLIADIMYIEVYGHESRIHMADGTVYSTNQSLKSLEEAVGPDFIRSHKSYLVNAAFVLRPTESDFLLKNGERIPISTDQRVKSRDAFFEWTFIKTWENR